MKKLAWILGILLILVALGCGFAASQHFSTAASYQRDSRSSTSQADLFLKLAAGRRSAGVRAALIGAGCGVAGGVLLVLPVIFKSPADPDRSSESARPDSP